MLLLKRRILLFLSKLSVLHNNPSEYFQKHKISKTKHSLQREVQWLKTTIIMLFLHCPKCQLFVDISVWYLFEQISACNCQNCKLFSVEQQSPQSISIMQFTHLSFNPFIDYMSRAILFNTVIFTTSKST